ncbi:MAG: hypothetical protein R3F43_26405 [bacterium]
MRRLIAATFALVASTGAAFAGSHTIDSCADPFETDIAAIYWQINDKWADFQDFVEGYTGYSLSGCLETRLTDNGDARCIDLPAGVAGRAWPGVQLISLDDGWLSDLEGRASTQKDRRACIAALMAHEHSHNCGASEGAPTTSARPPTSGGRTSSGARTAT